MPTPDVHAFVCASLPRGPGRVLEIGAGDGALAAALREAGYDVTAIDPGADDGTGVERTALLDATASGFLDECEARAAKARPFMAFLCSALGVEY